MSWALIAVTLMTLAPPEQDISSKRFRLAEIRTLARSDTPGDILKLMGVIEGQAAAWERQAALSLLRPVHRSVALPALERLSASTVDAITIEASIQWYRLTHSKKSLIALKRQLNKGANLRRAFQVSEKAGRPVYGASAQQFFMESVRSNSLYTRLDGALGLIELGSVGPHKAGIYVLDQEFASTNAAQRLAVIGHLSVQYKEAAFLRFLEAASVDPDAKVKALALSILSRE